MSLCIEELRTDLTATAIFQRLAAEPELAFLDSNSGYGRLGRWSILACRPWQRLRGWTDHCLLDGSLVSADPFSLLQKLLSEQQVTPRPDLPLAGGCIGLISYDAGFALNDLPLPRRVDCSRPFVRFNFYDNFIIVDHQLGQTWLMACGRLEPAYLSIERLKTLLSQPPKSLERSPDTAEPTCGSGRGRLLLIPARQPYLAKVDQLRDWIRLGEVYIANLTSRFRAASPRDSIDLYRHFRRINPAPFAALIRQDGLDVLSASPERFLSVRPTPEGGWRVETRPIKGTRPRSADPARDRANRQELENSGKDRSELLMIVDLERNDLSRVCRPDSVHVEELFKLETFPEVFHLVATVSGILQDGEDAVSCLRACFPGGSITGAPKMRAMELIDQLEDDARGFYTGCLGYFSADGQADFSIIIRTMVRQGDQILYGAGGGITWESNAADEYQELLDKAAFFRRLIEHDPD
jgi:para-aminobenzoate synthetase component 1